MSTPRSTSFHLIREALPEEYEAVGQLTWEGFGYHLPGSRLPGEGRRASLINAGVRARQGVLLVAEDLETGQLVGTASVLPSGAELNEQAKEGESELKMLAVLPQARRSGLGSRLLDEAVRVARSKGALRLVLDTAVDNKSSHVFYIKYGFVRRTDRERKRPAPEVQLAVFALDIASSN